MNRTKVDVRSLDDRGRLTIPQEIRGDAEEYVVLTENGSIVLQPIADYDGGD